MLTTIVYHLIDIKIIIRMSFIHKVCANTLGICCGVINLAKTFHICFHIGFMTGIVLTSVHKIIVNSLFC